MPLRFFGEQLVLPCWLCDNHTWFVLSVDWTCLCVWHFNVLKMSKQLGWNLHQKMRLLWGEILASENNLIGWQSSSAYFAWSALTHCEGLVVYIKKRLVTKGSKIFLCWSLVGGLCHATVASLWCSLSSVLQMQGQAIRQWRKAEQQTYSRLQHYI